MSTGTQQLQLIYRVMPVVNTTPSIYRFSTITQMFTYSYITPISN